MVFPVNFVVGAVVGAVSTYLYKDEASKKWFRDTGSKLKNRVCSVAASPVKPEGKVTESVAQAEVVTPEKMTEKEVSAKTEKTDTPKSRQRSKTA